MSSHIQPTTLVGLVASQAGYALAFGGILAVFVIFVHAKPLSPSPSCFIRAAHAVARFVLSFEAHSIAVGRFGC